MAIALACWGAAFLDAQDLRYLGHQAWGTEEGLPQSSVHAIVQGRDGYLWVATEGGLARFDGVSFRTYGRATDAALESDDICCLSVESDGALLVGTASGWLRMRDGKFRRADAKEPPGNGLPERIAGVPSRVQAVLVDREGLKWVGTRNGLQVLDPKTGLLQRVEALKGDSILCLFEDAEGNHWVGTETSGLHVLRRLKFRGEAGLAGLAVMSVVQASDGAMWVGTREDGVRRVQGRVVTEPAPVDRLTSAVALCMAPGPLGRVWIGTPDGLNLVSPRGEVTKITSADGLPDDYVRALAAGGDGDLWVATGHGLALVRKRRVARVWTAMEGLAGTVVGSLAFDGSSVWAGTSGGLSRLKADGSVENFGKSEGLSGAIVDAMAVDRTGTLWVVTREDGLKRLDGERFRPSWVNLPEPKGSYVGDHPVEGMTADAGGNLWLRFEDGIQRISASLLARCKSGSCGGGSPRLYGRADGLPSDEAVAGASAAGWLASDGEIWFPTRHGVGVADSAHLPIDSIPPPAVIENAWIEGEAGGSFLSNASIPYGNRRFNFNYAGLSFTVPSEVSYSYRLEGYDAYWTDAGSRRTATYTRLPPGDYLFRVTATNGDGVENYSGATMRFRVVPPFYRRWWFIALLALLVLAMLGGGYWARLRRVRRDFEVVLAERNRMAREIHDTLTQDFVGTSVQLDIVAQMLRRGKIDAALEQVVKTRRLVTDGLDEARRSIWELRSGGAEDGLPLRLRRLVEREEWAEIGAKVKVGGAVRALEPNVEREVLRVAREALRNVKRHARAAETSVDLHYSDEAVLLTIEDNGVGFRMEDVPAGHFGLMGMKERAEVVEGEFEIVSEPGKGTIVRLRIRAR
jgi:streptogramin lyase